ncbi:MAG: ROK family protein [Candidatus Kryptoniota bacterium]
MSMYTRSTDIFTGNSKVVRSLNRATILNIVREMQPISRIQIARLTGLHKSTVSSIISELLEEDLIFEQPSEGNGIGRNPINLYLKRGKFFVAGINIDSSFIKLALADIDGTVIEERELPIDKLNPEEVVSQSVSSLINMQSQYGIPSIYGIGISVAGIVDSDKMIVTYAPNLGWENISLGKIITDHLPDVENIAVGNDAKASALAELWFGRHELDLTNFVFLSVGAGIGAGIVLDGRLVNGEYYAAGEFGHMVIVEGGLSCTCGNRGCWEAYASNRSTIARYEKELSVSGERKRLVTMNDILSGAKNNDRAAISAIKDTAYYIGVGVSNIVRSFDPQTIIVGGKITDVWDLVAPEIYNVIMERAYFGRKKNINLLPTSLHYAPALMGAVALAIEKVFDSYKVTD